MKYIYIHVYYRFNPVESNHRDGPVRHKNKLPPKIADLIVHVYKGLVPCQLANSHLLTTCTCTCTCVHCTCTCMLEMSLFYFQQLGIAHVIKIKHHSVCTLLDWYNTPLWV